MRIVTWIVFAINVCMGLVMAYFGIVLANPQYLFSLSCNILGAFLAYFVAIMSKQLEDDEKELEETLKNYKE